MNKKIILKGVFTLLVIALLAIGFTGCGGYLPYQATGTVYLTIDSWDDYEIFMDYVFKGYSNYTSAYFVIYNVPVGYHTFEADGWWYYGSRYVYVSSGVNYITITTW